MWDWSSTPEILLPRYYFAFLKGNSKFWKFQNFKTEWVNYELGFRQRKSFTSRKVWASQGLSAGILGANSWVNATFINSHWHIFTFSLMQLIFIKVQIFCSPGDKQTLGDTGVPSGYVIQCIINIVEFDVIQAWGVKGVLCPPHWVTFHIAKLWFKIFSARS